MRMVAIRDIEPDEEVSRFGCQSRQAADHRRLSLLTSTCPVRHISDARSCLTGMALPAIARGAIASHRRRPKTSMTRWSRRGVHCIRGVRRRSRGRQGCLYQVSPLFLVSLDWSMRTLTPTSKTHLTARCHGRRADDTGSMRRLRVGICIGRGKDHESSPARAETFTGRRRGQAG